MFDRFCMCAIYAILFVLVYVIQKKAYNSFRTPLSFFALLWCVVGFCSNTTIMDYEHPSLLVNISIILGIILFTIVHIARTSGVGFKINNDWEFGRYNIINYRNIIIVNLVCWGFMIPRFKTAISILSSEGFAFLRANLSNQEVGLSRGGVSDIIFGYMVEPVFITTAILACFLLFSNEIKWKKILTFLLSIISIVAYAFTGAARGCLVKFGFCFFFVLIICKRKILLNIVKMKVVRYSMFLLVGIVLFITFQRGTFGGGESASDSIFRTFYIYYFSGPSYMTKLMEAQPQYGGFCKLLFGSATFGFITNFISWILIFLTGKNQGSLYMLGSVISNKYYLVAPSVRINAMYTCFYTFWIDWGYLGFIVGPILLALFSAYLFKKVYSEGDYRVCVMYVFWLYTLTRTVFKLDTIGVSITVVFICMRLFVRKVYYEEKYKEKFYL